MKEKPISKAVIPVAGYGTRLLPVTKSQPKEMLPIVDKPAVQYVVREAIDSGVESILFVTGRGKRAIEDYFDYAVELELELENKGKFDLLQEVRDIGDMIRIFYVRQKLQKGLGDAVYQAKRFINDSPFAVLLADDIIDSTDPVLRQMIDLYRKRPGIILAVTRIPQEEISQWGVIKGKEIGKGTFKVEDMIEKPDPGEAPSDLAIIGRYILTPSIFEAIEKVSPGKGGEIQLTDSIRSLLKKEEIYAYEFQGTYYGVGDKIGFLKANVAYALKRKDIGDELKGFLKQIIEEEK
ncbi:MAG TPA: UTP--glucose-1-phosphate uridylyltransferase GalU [Atribacter sp.]|jgi:UTP--glucose-1-phosphate uridylyltransferase|uniref:UTP--glucose-1-phosphate uridylyltransferase GalU n=1 Tax=Atribacter sp. TaxID=2847780 RepID=UPI002B66CD1C|nr:UTP--glucose-1-phosphate uridylyltransferase GalU [Atribacter sp.]HQK84139.1 UTP--glucose-1-phosphate uridylyltransferase GalU [Atribacter sp.]